MPVYVKIPPVSVVYREKFVMQPLYRITRHWLIENEYVDNLERRLHGICHGSSLSLQERNFNQVPTRRSLGYGGALCRCPSAGGRIGNKFL